MNRFVHRSTLDLLKAQEQITEIRDLSSSEIKTEDLPVLFHGQGNCYKGRCGQEAACKPLPNNTYTCVCPHDLSPPTADLRCPNRLTVPITPKPIHNIIPPVGNNDTTNNTIPITTTETTSTIIQNDVLTDVNINEPSILASSSWLFIGPIVIIFIFIICGLFLVCYFKKLSREKQKTPYSPSPLKKSILLSDRYTINTQYSPCTTFAVPLLQSDTLTFQCEIGEGCFGKVFKGELRREGSDQVEIVAIKVLKDSANKKAEEDFMREVDIMSAFRHENILTLIGVSLKDSGLSPMMVFEYMDYGDLAEVLRNNARTFNTISSKKLDTILDNRGLLYIALQIASGMRYLAAQRFVHRDLACRNCLVAQGLIVKIADFGMSRDVYTCDYYKIGGSRMLPVRWMSPESVIYGKFTLESDIWSYGVILWEIYSYGKQPYYGHTNEEVLQLILNGTNLILPENCPTYISKLVYQCWKPEPRDRIPFTEIYEELETAYECFESLDNIYTPAQSTVSTDEIKEKSTTKIINLPRPPLEPIVQLADFLDADGYLLPQETTPVNYLETLSD